MSTEREGSAALPLEGLKVLDLAWVVACNGVGSHADVTLGGHSVVVDPQGVVIAEAGDEETVLFADVEPGRSAQWREAFPALGDRH